MNKIKSNLEKWHNVAGKGYYILLGSIILLLCSFILIECFLMKEKVRVPGYTPEYTYIETLSFPVAGESSEKYIIRYLHNHEIIELSAYSTEGLEAIYKKMRE